MRVTLTNRLRPLGAALRNSAVLGTLLALPSAIQGLLQWEPGGLPYDLAFTWVETFIPLVLTALCVELGYRWLPGRRGASWVRPVVLALAAGAIGTVVRVGVCVYAPNPMDPMATGYENTDWWPYWGQWFTSVAALLVAWREFTERSRRAAQDLHGEAARQLALQAEWGQAQLSLLTAQIEPHFLFNSLANVRRLLRTDAASASLLLEDLLRYLEQALPRMRQERTTLGREAELVRAFLAVHQVRMAGRLRSAVDVPAELMDLTVPPMALLTLVENALKHGLQPLVEGGSIRVEAHARAGILTLSVADTGRGMGEGSGDGIGLANLSARLQAEHGAAAMLTLRVNVPRGVVATITLPQAA